MATGHSSELEVTVGKLGAKIVINNKKSVWIRGQQMDGKTQDKNSPIDDSKTMVLATLNYPTIALGCSGSSGKRWIPLRRAQETEIEAGGGRVASAKMPSSLAPKNGYPNCSVAPDPCLLVFSDKNQPQTPHPYARMLGKSKLGDKVNGRGRECLLDNQRGVGSCSETLSDMLQTTRANYGRTRGRQIIGRGGTATGEAEWHTQHQKQGTVAFDYTATTALPTASGQPAQPSKRAAQPKQPSQHLGEE
ncbi:hypothetical protein B0H34DRAFT_679804 [Crassisporium funariophilum]|nr:hypothetical protein B0H34DRAFT_679804 [Crassisporium funariophilum]